MDASTSALDRAAAAERAVLARFVRRVGPVAWARASAPGTPGERTWHYWWHAHLLHVLHDAERHRPASARRRLIRSLERGVTLRTGGRWTTPYYDDIAWMALALEAGGSRRRAWSRIARRLDDAVDPGRGVLPWRVGSTLYNAPANAPGSLVLLAAGRRAAAERIAGWMASTLDDPQTGLVRDGVEDGRVRPDLWTYNQGAVLALERALARGADAHAERAAAIVRAVETWCAPDDGLFPAAGGGDGGLFAGILARYLVAGAGPDLPDAMAAAHRLVRRNADALWAGRDGDLFSADPRRPARPSDVDLDLSVQLGAWITLEAAIDADAGVTS